MPDWLKETTKEQTDPYSSDVKSTLQPWPEHARPWCRPRQSVYDTYAPCPCCPKATSWADIYHVTDFRASDHDCPGGSSMHWHALSLESPEDQQTMAADRDLNWSILVLAVLDLARWASTWSGAAVTRGRPAHGYPSTWRSAWRTAHTSRW